MGPDALGFFLEKSVCFFIICITRVTKLHQDKAEAFVFPQSEG